MLAMAKVFFASLTLRRLVLRRLQDYETTSGCRSTLRRQTTKDKGQKLLQKVGFAIASQTTSPQDHETTSGCRSTSCLVD